MITRKLNICSLLNYHFRVLFLCFIFLLPLGLKSQVPTWVNEGFGASPYPVNSTYYLGNASNSWLEGEVAGLVGFPNKWVQTVVNGVPATYQTTNGGLVQFSPSVFVTNHAQFAGAGFLQYNNRSTNYPATTNVSQNGDVGFIATRSLDFSGHTTYNALTDTLGFWFWRDNTTIGGVDLIADSIVVYINTDPFLQGPNLVKLTEINTSSATIPRSSTLLPLQSPVGGGWRRCTYNVPNTPSFTGATATSNAYVIVVAYSHGGNNMFLDDFTLPEWKTAMVIQSATIFYQENADVGKNSTNNLILGAKVTTRGSATPLKIDAATFSSTGCTAFANDVQNPLAFYSGAASNFSSPAGVISMPLNAAGPVPGLLNFGWAGGSCAPSAAPASMQLSPGGDNYIWLTYDIKSTAQVQNYVGADFQFITSTTGSCFYVGATTSTNLGTIPILPQSLNKARQIESTYPIPTYIGGLGVPGYWDFDCISGVFMPGDNGTQLQNYLHDEICPGCQSVHPIGDPQNAYCIRWACHPNDYTNFKPVNAGTFKNRFVQITSGTGIRTGTAPYQLRILGGNVIQRIAAFIDWNKDGDFDDTYTGTTGVPAQDVVISEYYGTHVVTAGNLTQFPVTSWIGTNLWNIQVPTTSDFVTDLNDVNQPPNSSIGPLAVSNVRMRLRCSINGVANIGPFTNGYTEGETEDYTIQVLDNCPAPGYNICKWIGTTSDWNVNTNWCPSIPTINDLAYIPIVSSNFYYPTITANTNAECRQLKLMDNGTGVGAKLIIDANTNSKLTVADDIIIGQNAPVSGSNASIAVISDLNKQITIPGKSVLPPLGNALAFQTPFRTNTHAKTQIAYTAAELGTTYGLKAGDIIDQISIEVGTIVGGAAPASYPNFQINAYLTVAPVTFPFPAPATTKIAVAAGDPNVQPGWPKLIYSSALLTLNMPMAGPPSTPCFCGGTKAGGNYFTFNLIPSTLIWDGVSNLVLSFEYKTTFGANPVRAYVLYNEAGAVFNVLSLNAVSAGNVVTGWNIDGSGHYSGGNSVNVGLAIVSNQRPRLDFSYHRPYEQFNITVGGKLINNNKLIRPSTYSTTPIYNIAGDSGFVASNSKVIYNPTIRSTVSTPGFPGNPGLTAVNSFNPVAQGATLITDIDQEITSANNASTVFNCLEIDKISATGKSVKQNSAILALTGAYCDTLILTNGELNLNRREFTLQKSSTNNLAYTNGWIRSEDNIGGLAGNIQSKFSWNIGTQTGLHSIPFGKSSTSVFPFLFNISSGDAGVLTVATYSTPQNNTAFPVSPTNVTSLTSMGLPAVDWTVDRFWMVKKSSTTPITGTIRFNYPSVEGTALAAYSAGNMKAQRYEYNGTAWAWHLPYAGQSDGNPGPAFVNHDAAYVNDLYTIWTIVSLNNGQTPLPLQVLSFDAKAFDNKVKLWWNVANENEVSKYVIERTIDKSIYDFIAAKKPETPSVINANYESYDLTPKKGINYYRLTTLKNTGETSYSDLKPVTIDAVFEIINTAKSQNDDELKIDFYYDSNLPYHYKIVDLLGNLIAEGTGVATVGQNSLSIPFNAVAGIYFISLGNSEKVLTHKVVY